MNLARGIYRDARNVMDTIAYDVGMDLRELKAGMGTFIVELKVGEKMEEMKMKMKDGILIMEDNLEHY